MDDPSRLAARWWPLALLLTLPLLYLWTAARFDLGGRSALMHWSFLVCAGTVVATSLVLFWAVAVDATWRLWLATPGALVGGALVALGIARTIPREAPQAFLVPTAGILVPVGAVVPFAGDAERAPADWLPCDGRQLERDVYPLLYEAIGGAHGSDEAGTTFRLPDYRGRFLRGVDGDAGRDPDRAERAAPAAGGNTGDRVGSVQDDALAAHEHRFLGFKLKDFDWTRGVKHPANGTGDAAVYRRTEAAGGTETRPRNANVVWLIRAR